MNTPDTPESAAENRRSVSPDALAYARLRVDTVGADATAAEFGLSRGALLNALACLKVTNGTRIILELAHIRHAYPAPEKHPDEDEVAYAHRASQQLALAGAAVRYVTQ